MVQISWVLQHQSLNAPEQMLFMPRVAVALGPKVTFPILMAILAGASDLITPDERRYIIKNGEHKSQSLDEREKEDSKDLWIKGRSPKWKPVSPKLTASFLSSNALGGGYLAHHPR